MSGSTFSQILPRTLYRLRNQAHLRSVSIHVTIEEVKVMATTLESFQLPVCKEVQDFLAAAEKLLSPILRDKELTAEECHLISEYLTTMCLGNHPWGSHLDSMMDAQGPHKPWTSRFTK